MTNKVLGSENTQYGFYGTINNYNSTEETEIKWAEAFTTLLELSGAEPEEIRLLLDSRCGRHFADACIDSKDIKQTTKECYFEWLAKELFEDETSNKPLETEKNTILFGTRVYNMITDKVEIILYTYKNKNRIHEDYALCLDVNQKKHRIGMDYIKPIEDMEDEELFKYGLK